jgi:predicted kinase
MSFSLWLEERMKRLPIVKKKTLIIMRGIPGAGKSRKVQSLLIKYGGDAGHVFSTDNTYIPETLRRRKNNEFVPEAEELEEYTRNYPKDAEGASKAHQQTLERAKYAIDNGMSPVIVDNTNISWRAMQSYVEYADKAGYEIRLEEPESPWWKEYRPYLRDKDNPENAAKLAEFQKILVAQNKHGVPKDVIANMIKSWQEIDLDEKLGRHPS